MSTAPEARPLDPLTPGDPFAPEVALRAPGLLRAFNEAGVIAAADVHTSRLLARLGGVSDQTVMLALALAVRAPRTGHVFVDLDQARETCLPSEDSGVEPGMLPWPEPTGWVAAVAAATELVAVGEDEDGAVRPARLLGRRLYLDRYWREERALAASLLAFATGGIRPTEIAPLTEGVARLFPDEPSRPSPAERERPSPGERERPFPQAPEPGEGDRLQRAAAASAVLRGVSVIAGGPGTGKTTTVARLAALLFEQASLTGAPPPLIGLCAPTGKAAARLEEAVREQAEVMSVGDEVRGLLGELRAGTIHKLLGWRPGSRSRFRHDAGNRLPHDVVIVDETSMVGLSLMVRLLEAVRSDARVVLVGDPDQLTAIAAGAVLRDIVGPAALGLRLTPGSRALLERITGGALPGGDGGAAFGDGVIVLERGHRFGVEIGAVATAIRRGDAEGTLEALRGGGDAVRWLAVDAGGDEDLGGALGLLREESVRAGTAIVAAARAGDGAAALGALGRFRLLCAHRRGPYGVSTWTREIESWLGAAVPGFVAGEPDYAGRPLLITENDYELGLMNGDTGVIVRGEGERLSAMFEREGRVEAFAPSRLESVETLHAMTIHKSQGSQFELAAVLLPAPDSRILTRELLYTAVTRARGRLILVGSEESVRAAVERPVARATGLRERLWSQ
jgi:exodeoxyribonuclease V alpha subunit